MNLDEKIAKFIKKMHLLSLCVLIDENGENLVYPASSFYAFDELNLSLIIAASSDTKHIKAALKSPKIAGTIALDTKIIGKIKGVQFMGEIRVANENEQKIYFKRFPYAIAMKPKIFTINLTWVKFTCNSLGFGKKIEWKRAKVD